MSERSEFDKIVLWIEDPFVVVVVVFLRRAKSVLRNHVGVIKTRNKKK